MKFSGSWGYLRAILAIVEVILPLVLGKIIWNLIAKHSTKPRKKKNIDFSNTVEESQNCWNFEEETEIASADVVDTCPISSELLEEAFDNVEEDSDAPDDIEYDPFFSYLHEENIENEEEDNALHIDNEDPWYWDYLPYGKIWTIMMYETLADYEMSHDILDENGKLTNRSGDYPVEPY